jgi:glucokinase
MNSVRTLDRAERVLVADVGGTHIRAAIVCAGTIMHKITTDTPHDDPRPSAVFDLIRQVLRYHPASSAVVGLPGRVNYTTSALEFAPNLPQAWASELCAARFRGELGVDTAVANDADLAAIGETYFGAGRGYDDVVYLTISTGVGGGVLLGGRLVAGTNSLAEIGHVVIDRVAARNGHPSTVEQLGSGSALARDASAAGVNAHDEGLMRLLESNDRRLGDAWRDVQEAVGYAAVTMAQLFSPQIIVIGGGLGRASSSLLEAAEHHLRIAGPRGLLEPITVVGSELGDDAGLYGAAAWMTATTGPGSGLGSGTALDHHPRIGPVDPSMQRSMRRRAFVERPGR